ncbi:unnamed protein product [Soboliphyme baturini]|uniref:Uncharacterized protein n=1 Tax=Soboliphyme baturini TaxID=241478 RepID=A0A183IM64_9BILA|nr:unnamed protein product [Soboliphyme baturini]
MNDGRGRRWTRNSFRWRRETSKNTPYHWASRHELAVGNALSHSKYRVVNRQTFSKQFPSKTLTVRGRGRSTSASASHVFRPKCENTSRKIRAAIAPSMATDNQQAALRIIGKYQMRRCPAAMRMVVVSRYKMMRKPESSLPSSIVAFPPSPLLVVRSAPGMQSNRRGRRFNPRPTATTCYDRHKLVMNRSSAPFTTAVSSSSNSVPFHIKSRYKIDKQLKSSGRCAAQYVLFVWHDFSF